ncbi:RHS repeat-associated core domain-containing protein, partial [archaeon]|nr:RHS repeat-associated core domain-containing protein [archaeon]
VSNSGVKYAFATGKELDESDLYYFGARYYDSDLGRFTSVDPVKENEPYSYVRNNPLYYVDPDGKEVMIAIYDEGSHANLFLNLPGEENDRIYDPSGSYRYNGGRPGCAVFGGEEGGAQLEDYLYHWIVERGAGYYGDDGSEVTIFIIKTSPEFEEELLSKLDSIGLYGGGDPPCQCAWTIINLLKDTDNSANTDEFDGIDPFTMLPNGLKRDLENDIDPTPEVLKINYNEYKKNNDLSPHTRYYEDDSYNRYPYWKTPGTDEDNLGEYLGPIP